jgi:hypothetical protein
MVSEINGVFVHLTTITTDYSTSFSSTLSCLCCIAIHGWTYLCKSTTQTLSDFFPPVTIAHWIPLDASLDSALYMF